MKAVGVFAVMAILMLWFRIQDTQAVQPAELQLAELQPETRERTMSEYEYTVLKYEVIDGDTVRCWLDLGFDISKKIDVRIEGVNTPEKRGHEKTAGIPVTEVVKKFLKDHGGEGDMRVISTEWGKYAGRCVGDIRIDGFITLSQFLRDTGICQVYGDPDFTEAELESIANTAQAYLEGE